MLKIFKILAILFLFFVNINNSFSVENIGNKQNNLDNKIELINKKIINSNKTVNKKIKFYNYIIYRLKILEKKIETKKNFLKKNDKNLEDKLNNILFKIKYIKEKFKTNLYNFKKENNLLNIIKINPEIGEVQNYKVIKKEFSIGKNKYLILRNFKQNNKNKYLILDLQNYITYIIDADYIKELNNFSIIYNNSKYKEIQNKIYNHIPNKKTYLQNNGLKHSLNKNNKKIYFTADFCPSSKKGFEDKIFKDFMKSGNKNVAIAITSAWIKSHPKGFQTLINWQKSNKLNITWINHTKTHKYIPGKKFSKNFILSPGLKLDEEITDVEKRLIENGQTPSIFLRFPGLVSDKKTREKVIFDYSLIPLGADSWLAKGERPKPGSIILIHGNKNEPVGIPIMRKIINQNKFKYGNINELLK